jgi:hypothetical protein
MLPGAPNPNMVCIDNTFWTAHMQAPDSTRNPWGTGLPTEEDLLELTPALNEGDLPRTSCSLRKVRAQVDVVVHHRGLGAVPGTDVRVTLLRWIDPRGAGRASWSDHTTWFTADVPWTAAVNDVLNSAGGTTAQSFGAGWAFVGTTATRRQSLGAQQLDPMRSGVVTFDLDLRALRNNEVVLLVAVVRGLADVALAPARLHELALTSPNVAVRSLRVVT